MYMRAQRQLSNSLVLAAQDRKGQAQNGLWGRMLPAAVGFYHSPPALWR